MPKKTIMNSLVTGSVLIGLTGGIASGKSTVLQHLRQSGYSVINADKLGHKVLEKFMNINVMFIGVRIQYLYLIFM